MLYTVIPDLAELATAIDAHPEGGNGWKLEGLCAEIDGEQFFPEKGCSTKSAKKVCAGCPVRMQCAVYAFAGNERYGVWGGLSEADRDKIRGDRARLEAFIADCANKAGLDEFTTITVGTPDSDTSASTTAHTAA
ncbi:WhiB family transcriptional regulator [Saccharopolyspora griseoalba]|uniref:Transcriptional regulator WhiB n=1 Tax=Saccharopolyspora griseoalba TaxID=1431848 RepID=A0ABW2LQT0_9PSEU